MVGGKEGGGVIAVVREKDIFLNGFNAFLLARRTPDSTAATCFESRVLSISTCCNGRDRYLA